MPITFGGLLFSPFGSSMLAFSLLCMSINTNAIPTPTPTLTATTTATTTLTTSATSTITGTSTTSTTLTASSTFTSDGNQRVVAGGPGAPIGLEDVIPLTLTPTRTPTASTNFCPVILYPNSLQGRIAGRAGLVVWVNCVEGYIGGGYNFCQADGTWVGTVPQCTEIPPFPCTNVTVGFTTDSSGPQVGYFVNRTNYSMPIGSVPANTVFSQTMCVTRGRDSLVLYGSPVFARQGFVTISINGSSRCVSQSIPEGLLYKLLSCRGESVVRDGVINQTSTAAEPSAGLPAWAWMTVGVTIAVLSVAVGALTLVIWRMRQPKDELVDIPTLPKSTVTGPPQRCPANSPHARKYIQSIINTPRGAIGERSLYSALTGPEAEGKSPAKGDLIIDMTEPMADTRDA